MRIRRSGSPAGTGDGSGPGGTSGTGTGAGVAIVCPVVSSVCQLCDWNFRKIAVQRSTDGK